MRTLTLCRLIGISSSLTVKIADVTWAPYPLHLTRTKVCTMLNSSSVDSPLEVPQIICPWLETFVSCGLLTPPADWPPLDPGGTIVFCSGQPKGPRICVFNNLRPILSLGNGYSLWRLRVATPLKTTRSLLLAHTYPSSDRSWRTGSIPLTH